MVSFVDPRFSMVHEIVYVYIWYKIDKKLPRATEVTGGRGSG